MDNRQVRFDKELDRRLGGGHVGRAIALGLDPDYDKYFTDDEKATVSVTVRCDMFPTFHALNALNQHFGAVVTFDAFDDRDGTIDLNWETTIGSVKHLAGPDDGIYCHAHDCPYPTSQLGHDTCGYSPKPEPREMLFECAGCPTTVRITQATGTEGPEGWSAVPGSNGRLCCAVCQGDEQVLKDFRADCGIEEKAQ